MIFSPATIRNSPSRSFCFVGYLTRARDNTPTAALVAQYNETEAKVCLRDPRKWCQEVLFRPLLPRAPVGQDDGSLSKLPQISGSGLEKIFP